MDESTKEADRAQLAIFVRCGNSIIHEPKDFFCI